MKITLGFHSRYKGVRFKKLWKKLGGMFILGGTLKNRNFRKTTLPSDIHILFLRSAWWSTIYKLKQTSGIECCNCWILLIFAVYIFLFHVIDVKVTQGGTFILGGTLSKKLWDVTGGTFILGGTFQKNLSKAYRVRSLERVRLFGTG